MSSWERKGYRPHQASDDVSDDDTVEEVYNAKENKVEEMIRRFSKMNRTEVATPDYQDEYNDDDRTMSSMSTMFRKARGDRHVSSEPLDYSTYQFDDDATMDSLSDVFKRQGTVDRRSPTVFQFKDDDNSTETVKTATTWKSRNRNHENGGLEGILRNKTNMHDEEEFGTINLHDQAELGAIENEKGKKNGNDGNNDDEQEKGSVKEEDLSQTKRAPRKKNAKKRSMSNRKFCCISFAFVAVVAISTFVTFQFYYKNWGKSDKFKTSDATPKDDQANLSPAVAPGRNGHSPTTQTNVGHIPSQPGNENDFEYVPSSSDVSKPVSRPVTSDVSRPIPVSVFDLLDRPTQKPATDYIGMLMEFLQDNQVYFDRDPLSPDFMAVQWLAEEAEVRETEENAYGNGLELTDKLIQRFAVITLDYALNRPNITMLQKQYRAADFNNYKKLHTIAVKDRDECKWHGVHCAKVGLTAGKVEEIRFSHSGLTGTIPPEINLLKDLKVLDLSGNRLRGAIPDSLYSIKQLEKLYLYQNQLTGTISENIKNWNNM
ncbi:unnamed protein product [Pseudo-nitzschia multistriata]|uniref:Leucine-rich repeat-containing N-terminal plant-type domain-containing protein n=1 Tax=Pseudo-nitzschia multistriata TaxID=183589 RepID=A0A448Z9C2_9STRA|nr:unnamed protein product [Pseudo-nitzschia multistriata]